LNIAPTLAASRAALPPDGAGPCLGRPCAVASPRHQHGAALLAAMLTVTLVATISSAAMWQQWRSVEVEASERARAQDAWILTGAMDWARLILREDARTGGADDLTEPWAVPLAESRLSTFLAAEGGSANDNGGAHESFLSGRVTDMQSRLNVNNLVEGSKVSENSLRTFARLFKLLNVPIAELQALAENLRFASDTSADNRSGNLAPLRPQRLPELTWLGLSPQTLEQITPYITLLPARTPVNLNTASPEVIYAAVTGLDMAGAENLVTQRERSPFRTLADATRLMVGIELSAEQHSVGTRFFEVRGRLRTPRGTVEEQSLIQRDGLEVKLLRRERIMPQPARVNPDGSQAEAGRDISSLMRQ
jgi:general secretion pathway protein K